MTIFKIIIEEPPHRCEGCGLITTTRPYGIKHEEICEECALKDPMITEIRMKENMFGENNE
jgi:hypothetical protein